RRLRLVGPAPAEAYTDALQLLGDDRILKTTTHLVSHLAREIEGHLRSVSTALRVLDQEHNDSARTDPSSSEDNHRKSIQLAGAALGFSPDDSVLGLWQEVCDTLMETMPHRYHLSGWRPLDEEFLRRWDQFETVLDLALDRFEARFLESRPLLDELLAVGPTRASITRLRASAPNNPVTLGYFFERAGREWLPPLRAADFFRHPPPPEEVQGGVRFPDWPQATYLVRVAPEEPAEVAEIIGELPDTDNGWTHLALIPVLEVLPATLVVPLLPKVLGWLGTRYPHPLLADRLVGLAASLANSGFAEGAFLVADAVFTLSEQEDHRG
ncbi:MAG: hypothetical protein V2A76_05810, partial [Planctomycetota bacterium]